MHANQVLEASNSKNPLKCKGTFMRINANRLVCNLMKQVNNGIPLGINFNTLIN